MEHVRSADGTKIAYERTGEGRPLILVDGALSYRALGSARPLASLLARRFSVLTYDRRGRGDSDAGVPYVVEREIDDLAALIDVVGGPAGVYGFSSGAGLALRAAAAGLPIDRLALYEPPFAIDPSTRHARQEANAARDAALAADRPSDAVRLFLLKSAGAPRPIVALMRLTPGWKKSTAVAHTLPYESAVLSDDEPDSPVTAVRFGGVDIPTLVLAGGRSNLRDPARAVAAVLPNAEHRILPRQMHMVRSKALAPVLIEFFASADDAAASDSSG